MYETLLIATGEGALDPIWIGVLVLVLIIAVIFFVARKSAPPAEIDAKAETRAPKKSVLEDRLEVDAPIEITDGMSLAEIKRAKSAKIVGDKGKRETALEATQKSKDDHEDKEPTTTQEAEEDPQAGAHLEQSQAEAQLTESGDVSSAWEDMLDGEEDDLLGALSSNASDENGPQEIATLDPELERDSDAWVTEPEVPEPEPVPVPLADPPKPIAAEPAGSLGEESSIIDSGARLSDGLAKTRTGFIGKLGDLFKGDKLNENLVDEIEEVLFTADIGNSAASDILKAVQSQLNSDQKQDPAAVWGFVRQYVLRKLKAREEILDLNSHHPFVILVVGVNGVGKTTTIGKLASKYKKAGKSVLMVAGDTFRAAAVEQLGVWGERTNIDVHQGEQDSDPSSVIYAGIERGVKEGVDVIICDTAGRLHTKANLLDELRKMNRVASKVIESAPHETILVLDANTGQNAIQQAKLFKEAVDITGIVLTKLDGTAKGGVILGICEELEAPIRYIGIGESVSDLRAFSADEFVEALFM